MQETYRSPWMTEDLDMLRTTARRFFEEEVAPKAAKFRAQHHIANDLCAIGHPSRLGHAGRGAIEFINCHRFIPG